MNFMISAFQFKTHRKNDFSRKSIKTLNYALNYEDLVKSKTFWIKSIYLFLSITLLTGLHMYEYYKCFLC